jgi:hypothetical protein
VYPIARHLRLLAPIFGLPLLLLPANLVWLEMIVRPVSALAFEGEPALDDVCDGRPVHRLHQSSRDRLPFALLYAGLS